MTDQFALDIKGFYAVPYCFYPSIRNGKHQDVTCTNDLLQIIKCFGIGKCCSFFCTLHLSTVISGYGYCLRKVLLYLFFIQLLFKILSKCKAYFACTDKSNPHMITCYRLFYLWCTIRYSFFRIPSAIYNTIYKVKSKAGEPEFIIIFSPAFLMFFIPYRS